MLIWYLAQRLRGRCPDRFYSYIGFGCWLIPCVSSFDPWREGLNSVLIEQSEKYQDDIERRMRLCLAGPVERGVAKVRAKKQAPVPLFGESE